MPPKKVRKGKKRWYPILAPSIFEKQELGDTYVYETEQLIGKHMSVNLMTLTGNPKKQNMSVSFMVNDVKEGKAYTKLLGIEMQAASMKRLARRGRSKIADSFRAKTKAGHVVVVKPIIITRTRADNETQTALRKRTRQLLADVLNNHRFDSVVSDVVHNRLQRHLKDQLSAIFPVRSADIRYLHFRGDATEEEGDLEEIAYTERPKRPKQDAEGLASLKEEVEEALAADDSDEEDEDEEKEESASTPKKKPSKKSAKKP